MKITDHFDSAEFRQNARHGFGAVEYPDEWIPNRLSPLCVALEVIRVASGGTLQVLSGYRSPAYNKKIGGAKSSQHMEGRAADIKSSKLDAAALHALVLRLSKEGKIKIGGLGEYPTFVHVDVRSGGKRLARWRGARADN